VASRGRLGQECSVLQTGVTPKELEPGKIQVAPS
jgi:hypothetical protein